MESLKNRASTSLFHSIMEQAERTYGLELLSAKISRWGDYNGVVTIKIELREREERVEEPIF